MPCLEASIQLGDGKATIIHWDLCRVQGMWPCLQLLSAIDIGALQAAGADQPLDGALDEIRGRFTIPVPWLPSDAQ